MKSKTITVIAVTQDAPKKIKRKANKLKGREISEF